MLNKKHFFLFFLIIISCITFIVASYKFFAQNHVDYHSNDIPTSVVPNNQIINLLLNDPLTLLKHNLKIKADFERSLQSNKKYINSNSLSEAIREYKKTREDFVRRHPLFSITECLTDAGNQENWNEWCLLTRSYKPTFRASYEETVYHALLEKIGSDNKPIMYTSFASGNLLSELIILTKTLMAQPQAHIAITLIDLQYKHYFGVRYLFNKQRTIHQNQDYTIGEDNIVSLDAIMDDLIALYKTTNSNKCMSNDELEKSFTLLFLDQEAQFKEFVSFFKQFFPDADLSFTIFDTSWRYINYLNDKSLSYPDVLATADIQDSESNQNKAVENFLELCSYTLSYNPSSYIIWLAKNEESKTASLNTVSLQKTAITNKAYFENSEKINPVYIAEHAIE